MSHGAWVQQRETSLPRICIFCFLKLELLRQTSCSSAEAWVLFQRGEWAGDPPAPVLAWVRPALLPQDPLSSITQPLL